MKKRVTRLYYPIHPTNTVQKPAREQTCHVATVLGYVTDKLDWSQVSPGQTQVWDLARSFKQFVIDQMVGGGTLMQSKLMGFYLSRQPNLGSGTPTVVISSWGILPFQDFYGEFEFLDANFIQNVSYNSWPTASVYTVKGNMKISFLAPYPRFTEDNLNLFVEKTMKLLGEMR